MTVISDVPGWVQALLLGMVQGLTEFIPVSSSAHLVLVPALAGWERHGLAFDVALHVGTLVALILYYRKDLSKMVLSLTTRTPSPQRDGQRRLIVLLTVASAPVAVVGLTLGDAVESLFVAPAAVSWLLLVTALVLVGGERLHRRRLAQASSPVHDLAVVPADPEAALDPASQGLGIRQVLIVGVAQAFALLPGLSRSGLTISAGIAAGMSRLAATRFAFLLGLPAIAGAAVVQLPHVDDLNRISTAELLVGVASAALFGYLAIALLVRLVIRTGIDRFAWYVAPLSIVSLFILR